MAKIDRLSVATDRAKRMHTYDGTRPAQGVPAAPMPPTRSFGSTLAEDYLLAFSVWTGRPA